MAKGIYLCVEGIDGSGKSTAVSWIKEFFESKGRDVITVREPGSTAAGERVREILKSDLNIAPMTELLLMFSARSQLIEEVIQPALSEGKVVISDRCYLSSYAYQGAGRGICQKKIEALEHISGCTLRADLLFVFSMPYALAKKRWTDIDRIEGEGVEFFEKVSEFYTNKGLEGFAKRTKKILAFNKMEEVRSEILKELKEVYNDK